ncbi:hypothetical protein BJY52DRAFT_1232373 [Lactarius psammicola]|nr:hypothetical protein BJY52DRAFT_1232373 [Lactarius psammicola]
MLVGNVAIDTPSAASIPEPMAEVGDSTIAIPRNGKKRRRASGSGDHIITTRLAAKRNAAGDFTKATTGTMSKRQDNGDVPNDAPNTRGPKVARLQDKVKGKMAKNTSPQKRNGQKVRAEGEQAEAVSRKDGPPPQEENANETSEGGNEKALPWKDDDSIVENLKKEVQVLKSRFDMQEKVIEELKSRCETHERVLEMVRQEITPWPL